MPKLSSLPQLNAIIDVEMSERAGWRPLDVAHAFLDGGARFLQLRAKQLPSGPFLDLAREIGALANEAGALFIVNDRADVARLAGASGVHVGQDDLPPVMARAITGETAIIGLSTHSDTQLRAAAKEPVDYVAIGPVFGSVTKATGYEAVGLDMVRRTAEQGRPVVAIGGITVANAASVIAAGATSVAVIGDLLATGDPAGRTRMFLKALAEAAR